MNLNGGYAMIKYNSTQEELAIAYKSKRPVLFYDENQRSHWAVIEETATESVDEETQEPITLYEYSYRLLDEASEVVANPTLSGNEATLDGVEIDGTKYKVGGGSEVHLYKHTIKISHDSDRIYFDLYTTSSLSFTESTLKKHLYNQRIVSCGYFYLNGNGYPLTVLSISLSNEYIIYQNLLDGKTITFLNANNIEDTITEV